MPSQKTKASNPSITSKKLFSQEEDNMLKSLLSDKEKHNWKIIAQQIPGRSSRQCRERWQNYLNPKIHNPPWTDEEDKKLLDAIEIYGHQWAKIAGILGFRSDVNINIDGFV